jgi:hypothetical protein
MLIYKLPPDRSTKRVYVWRRLKRIGAIYLQDGTCLLPANDRTREQFQWLAAEIAEMTGEAYICRADFLTGDQEARVIEQFREQARDAYRQALASLEQLTEKQAGLPVEAALKEAWNAYGVARQIDFFSVPEGDLALRRLRELAQDIEDSRREGE